MYHLPCKNSPIGCCPRTGEWAAIKRFGWKHAKVNSMKSNPPSMWRNLSKSPDRYPLWTSAKGTQHWWLWWALTFLKKGHFEPELQTIKVRPNSWYFLPNFFTNYLPITFSGFHCFHFQCVLFWVISFQTVIIVNVQEDMPLQIIHDIFPPPNVTSVSWRQFQESFYFL